MAAFVSAIPVAAGKAPALTSSYTSSRPAPAARPAAGASPAPSMALRRSLTAMPNGSASCPSGSGGSTRSSYSFSGRARAAAVTSRADQYMAQSIVAQYKATACAGGTYGVQCTESTGKLGRTADGARVAALNAKFRCAQRSPARVHGDMYENRRQALKGTVCHTEERMFQTYAASTASYVLARAEATGACDKYGIAESVEEAAMMRFMHIQQQASVVGGVIPSSCVEGASKGAAEDARVAQLASKFRNAQKPTGQLLAEKYNQSRHGFGFANGCNYEEQICATYPAVASVFRSSSYGY
jgi:hypothetical protein